MSPKIRYTIFIAVIAIVKYTTPLKVYIIQDTLAKKLLNQETSIYLKPDVKNRENSLKHLICKRYDMSMICFITRLQEIKDVLRGGADDTIKHDSSLSSEEHSGSYSNEDILANFDDLTRGSQKILKNTKDRPVIQLKPVAIVDTDIEVGQKAEDGDYFTVAERRLGKITKKQPKIFVDNQETNAFRDKESESEDEDEDDEKESNPVKAPVHENVEESSESEETETGRDNKDASPETEEQVEHIKKKPLNEFKQFVKPDEPIKKRKKPAKSTKKHKIPKRFEVVANGDEKGIKTGAHRGDERDGSEEKSNESSINAAPDSNVDLTILEEKNSIEKSSEKPDLGGLIDKKEKYTYIQGLDKAVHVGKKLESSEERPLAEDDKTTEEDAALMYRRGGTARLPYFLPKRYFWSEEDYKNLGYFWFNGPQGKNSPGNYRIRYK